MEKIIYIDTETTGADPSTCGLLQLSGSFKINGQHLDTFNFRCKPFEGSVIEDEALKVNGITLDEIKQFPSPRQTYRDFVALLLKHINKYDKNDKFFFRAYSARYDSDVLRKWFTLNGDNFYGSYFYTPEMCVLQKAIWKVRNDRNKLPNFKLPTVCKHFGINADENRLHDAKYDIALTIALDEKLDTI